MHDLKTIIQMNNQVKSTKSNVDIKAQLRIALNLLGNVSITNEQGELTEDGAKIDQVYDILVKLLGE